MADLQQANGIQHKRKLVLRLDDGSLIGPVETLLGTSHGPPGAVLLDFEAACRTGRAGKTELDRLDRLIQDFQARVSGFHSIPRSELKQRNPYTQDVSDQLRRDESISEMNIRLDGAVAAARRDPSAVLLTAAVAAPTARQYRTAEPA